MRLYPQWVIGLLIKSDKDNKEELFISKLKYRFGRAGRFGRRWRNNDY